MSTLTTILRRRRPHGFVGTNAAVVTAGKRELGQRSVFVNSVSPTNRVVRCRHGPFGAPTVCAPSFRAFSIQPQQDDLPDPFQRRRQLSIGKWRTFASSQTKVSSQEQPPDDTADAPSQSKPSQVKSKGAKPKQTTTSTATKNNKSSTTTSFQETQRQLRIRRHTKYWKDHWQFCRPATTLDHDTDTDGHCRTLHAIQSFLDAMMQQGCRVNAMVSAARKLEARAQLALDYNHSYHPDHDSGEAPPRRRRNTTTKRSPPPLATAYSMGPLTLVLSTFRDSLKATEVEQKLLVDFVCYYTDTLDQDDSGDNEDNGNPLPHNSHRNTKNTNKDPTQTSSTTSNHTETKEDHKMADMLCQVQYRALFTSPLYWGKPTVQDLEQRRHNYQALTAADRRQQAVRLAVQLRRCLPRDSYLRVVWLWQGYLDATRRTTVVNGSSSSSSHPPPSNGTSVSSTRRRKLNPFDLPIRRLNKFLWRATGTHFHWVAADVARFLECTRVHASQSDFENEQEEKDNEDEPAEPWNTPSDDDSALVEDLEVTSVENDPLVLSAQQSWFRIRDGMARILLDLDERLVHSIMEQKQYILTKSEKGESVGADKDNPDFSIDVRKLRQETKKKHKIEYSHFSFDTLPLEEPQKHLLLPNRAPPFLVLLENLPIDVTEEELEKWYSRCGDIKSISIHNQRLDLDPGPLSPEEIRERRRKGAQRIGRWTRPRSPVYGLIQFSDESGYAKATQPGLSVFGMIAKRHDIRTIPSHTRLHTLYIEQLHDPLSQPALYQQQPLSLSTSLHVNDVEGHLQQLLDPVWITLTSGQDGIGAIGSCEVKFSSFEMSWWAYERLCTQTNLFCHVHWLPSPENSEEWWKREVGFF